MDSRQSTSDTEGTFLRETEPPPIIIKSGSFVIESDEKLKTPALDTYQREGFGKFRKIRVIYYNEIDPADCKVEDFDGWATTDEVYVNINLISDNWLPQKQFKIQDNGGNLEFQSPIKLSGNKDKKHKKRKAKREDDENDAFVFGRIQIVNKSQNRILADYQFVNGREYAIGFYPPT